MTLTPEAQTAISHHAAELGLSFLDYVHQAAADRALAWQRETAAFHELAERRGTTVEDILRRGCLTDEEIP